MIGESILSSFRLTIEVLVGLVVWLLVFASGALFYVVISAWMAPGVSPFHVLKLLRLLG